MEIRIIILAIIVLILVCIMVVFGCILRKLKEKYDELAVTSQRLVDAVKDIDGDLTGRRYCYYANLIDSSQLKGYNTSLEFTINNLAYDIGKLKEADDNKKELEMIAERKEKMADYLAFHANDSVTKRAAALYDIATGKTEEEEE